MGIELPSGYKPSEREPFMNERQREYFPRRLLASKANILRRTPATIQNLHADTPPTADPASPPLGTEAGALRRLAELTCGTAPSPYW